MKVHPSHRGSTYQRKPKKKKKKKRAAAARQEENYDAYYLAPVNNSPNYSPGFIEDDEARINDGGLAHEGEEEIAFQEAKEASSPGLIDAEQPIREDDEKPKPKKRRKKNAESIATMDSQRKTFEMLDYDKMAMASMDNVNLAVYSGQANINLGDGGDPNALLEPHEQDIYPEGETNNTGQLSYKKVKIH